MTDSLALRVEAWPLPASPVATVLPPLEAPETAGEDFGYAEGQTFVIEYVGSSGERSTRSITVLSIKKPAAGVPLLFAKCHLRKTTRSFRIDRIVTCIDFDGEVHEDVPSFLLDNFGMSADVAKRRSTDGDSKNWNRFRNALGSHLVLLMAMSHADAEMIPEEVGEIVEYCAQEARNMGIEPTEVFRRLAAGFVTRLRPEREHIAAALDRLSGDDPETIMRTLRAALRVIDADGLRHPEERALINLVGEELIGTGIV